MDIVLFNPYYSQTISYFSFVRPAAPLGLLYLAGYLRKYGLNTAVHELGIFDPSGTYRAGNRIRFGLTDDKISDIIRRERPKIVGITCMYSIYYRDVVDIARLVKKTDPSIKVVLGGNHASTYAQYILKDSAIDYVVIGEGEETFLELSKIILRGNAVDGERGLAYRKDGYFVKTEARPLISDLDNIPFPAYDIVDYAKYLNHGNPFVMRTPGSCIITSRGCPGDCVYCTVKAVWGRTWRGRTPKNVVDEIEFLTKRYGIREFAVLDDSASVNRQRWAGICQELIDRHLDLKWTTPNGIAHWTLSKETLELMQQAGCYRITFGIESGDVETRKFLGKPYSLSQALEMIRHANRIGLWTICTNIIGFPYERLKAVRATIDFAKRSGTDFACFFLLLPQPTSDVYRIFKKEGLLDFDRFFESTEFDEREFERIRLVLNETGCDTLHFTKEQLVYWQKRAYRSFIVYRAASYLINPLRLLRKIHSWEDLCYIVRLVKMGIQIFLRTLNPMNKKTGDFLYGRRTKDASILS